MGLQASIQISYSIDLDVIDFLNLLFEKEWHYNDYNKITFLVNNDFDWEIESIDNYDLILDSLDKRFTNNEIIGIALLNKNNIGGLLHFLPGKKEVMILLNINREKVSGTNLTNYSFYSEMLLTVLDNISEIKFIDTI
ncbi:hypothetical protein BSF41_46020 [Flavobacterium sp. ACN2]|jgi:hypothetical protein|uniref:hypothetical protein n=1 Tax=Flavobacterium sp. ACN2 TaxID=1975676 RepID=UPI000BB39CAB|nr:hypothetical protein [Flavobacterium sp. ACN2]PBI83248.1 hypothetical protein BSF41_46020 [Flavobacterium sp. ACN2]